MEFPFVVRTENQLGGANAAVSKISPRHQMFAPAVAKAGAVKRAFQKLNSTNFEF